MTADENERSVCLCFVQVVAIVMDLLTDLQILRDLFEVSKRGVPVYIVLDEQGAPHFLDMCSRLKVGERELKVHN